ncbi:MAG: PIN domain-containing protein [Candidatus Entotheonellia bacterium]
MSAPETESKSCFIDTNVWPYAFIEGDDRQKSARAKLLIEVSRAMIVSIQVINEVCVNLIKKAQFSEQQVQQLIESFYAKYVVVELNKPLLLKASALRAQYAFSFWDSTIVANALYADAAVLYSEDIQHGLVVDNLVRIINPFTELQETSAGSGGSSASPL